MRGKMDAVFFVLGLETPWLAFDFLEDMERKAGEIFFFPSRADFFCREDSRKMNDASFLIHDDGFISLSCYASSSHLNPDCLLKMKS